jgi:hypothetical protein
MSDDERKWQVVDDDGTVLAEWPMDRKPGPRPYDGPQLKTSCRVIGQRQVDDFRALCLYYGRRPHQLVADWVLEAIERHRKDPEVAPYLANMLLAMQQLREFEQAIETGKVVDLRLAQRRQR